MTSQAEGRARFFEACPAAAALVGYDGRVHDVNPAWSRMTGWEANEVIGHSLLEFLHPDDLELAFGDVAPFREGRFAGTWQGRCLGRAGAEPWLSWEVAAEPEHARYSCVARRLSAEERRRQDRFKADFINLAGHELNTPLTPIQLALDTLEMRLDTATGGDQLRSVAILQRNFQRLARLVADILDSARLHAGRLPLELEETNLSDLAQRALDAKREQAAQSGVNLRGHLEPGLLAVVDPARVLQVLDNYLACGLGCAPTGGQVELRIGRQDAQAQVTVGCPASGLTEEQRSDLFRPFPTHEVLVQPQERQTGLGLYVARGIIELHGGQVAVQSDGPDAGLVLSFVLPLGGPGRLPAPLARPAGPEVEGDHRGAKTSR